MQTLAQRFKLITSTIVLVVALVGGALVNNNSVNAAPPLWQAGQVTHIDSGDATACGIANGTAYCWGKNDKGQLGNGTNTDSNVPVAVDVSGVLAGKTVTNISVGSTHACAIANGAAYCWGENNAVQLGNGTNTDSNVPVAVDVSGGLTGKTVTDISVASQFGCLVADGAAYCWGYNTAGELGTGDGYSSNKPVPVATSGVLAGKTVTSVTAGNKHACVIANAAAYCWGSNSGALGNGVNTNSDWPVAVNTTGVLAGKTITNISAGYEHVCVVASSAAYCWGGNFNGTLGNGSNTASNIPVTVSTSGAFAGKTVTSVSAGYNYTCAVADAIYCWGSNGSLQLGDTGSPSSFVPVVIDGSEEFSDLAPGSVSAGSVTTCATAEQIAFCWGSGLSGQLGNGTDGGFALQASPVHVVTRAPNATDKKVTNVSFVTENGKKIMKISGEYMLNSQTDWISALYGSSLVTLNGTALDFCADGTGMDSAALMDLGAAGVTDSPPCYYLLGPSLQVVIDEKMASVYLSDDFDVSAPGYVSVNGSDDYQFNQNTQPNDPTDPTVVVNNKSLEGTPTITKRPVFSGVAEPGSTVTVTVHSDPVSCTTTADSNGNWLCTLPTDLAPGQHTVYVHVVAPGNVVTDLGPYSVTVPGAATLTNQTPLAPMTGEERIAAVTSPPVLLVAAGAIFTLTVLLNMGYKKLQSLRVRKYTIR